MIVKQATTDAIIESFSGKKKKKREMDHESQSILRTRK